MATVKKNSFITITDETILKAKNGDKLSRQMILEAYMPLTLSLVNTFNVPGHTSDDLIQQCNLAILNAILLFKVGRAFPPYVKMTILNTLRYLYVCNPRECVPLSLNSKVNNEVECDFVDLLIDDSAIIDKDLLESISENTVLSAFEYLDNDERHLCDFLIFSHYPSTLKAYSKKYNIPYTKCRSIKNRAKKKLRNILVSMKRKKH